MSIGPEFEKVHAQKDVLYTLEEYGESVTINLRGEQNVNRDLYNSIKRYNTPADVFTTVAWPVEFNPSEKTLQWTGFKEDIDVVIHTPMKAWGDAGYSINDIDTERSTVTLRGRTYRIKDKKEYGQYYNDYLYIILGLVS
jgi:hypothetical protein